MKDRALLLKCDYSAEPFWRRDGANVAAAALPLSEKLQADLRAWSSWFETSAYWEHSSAHELRYFESDEENDEFELEGLRLWLLVRQEAGVQWLIGYYSLTRKERVWDPAKLPRGLFSASLFDELFEPPPVPAPVPPASAVQGAAPSPPKSASETNAKVSAASPTAETATEQPPHSETPPHSESLPAETGTESAHEVKMRTDPVYRETYQRRLAELLAG